MRAGACVVRWFGCLALMASATAPEFSAVQAQPVDSIRPEFRWATTTGRGHSGEETPSLRIEIPAGWALYAPDTGSLGLPLAAEWIDRRGWRREAPLDSPPGSIERSPAGEVSVYRDHVTVIVLGTPANPHDARLRIRWALCRAALCVPGTTDLIATGR